MGGLDTDSQASDERDHPKRGPLDSALAGAPLGGVVSAKVLRRVAIVLVAVAVVTVAHMSTPRSDFFLHSIFQHLYYVPIILGAVFFGWPGGLLSAVHDAGDIAESADALRASLRMLKKN